MNCYEIFCAAVQHLSAPFAEPPADNLPSVEPGADNLPVELVAEMLNNWPVS